MTAIESTARPPSTHLITAAFLMVAMAATVGGALGFQYIGGYIPCKLCYEQRIPYYVGAPLMAVALVAAVLGAPRWLTRLLLLAGGVLMVYSLYLGGHHAGIEWGWWPGPTDCGMVEAPASGGSGGILDQIDKVVPPSCDKAAYRDPILGLSLAGWNAVASLVLALIALRGAMAKE
jgi:disulfide bond formation protein DsbB